jgi:excisionase family DNA binding protein
MRIAARDIEPLLYSVAQVAKLIGFGRTKTYELVQTGKIPSILVEGRTRITRKALDAWIAQKPTCSPTGD